MVNWRGLVAPVALTVALLALVLSAIALSQVQPQQTASLKAPEPSPSTDAQINCASPVANCHDYPKGEARPCEKNWTLFVENENLYLEECQWVKNRNPQAPGQLTSELMSVRWWWFLIDLGPQNVRGLSVVNGGKGNPNGGTGTWALDHRDSGPVDYFAFKLNMPPGFVTNRTNTLCEPAAAGGAEGYQNAYVFRDVVVSCKVDSGAYQWTTFRTTVVCPKAWTKDGKESGPPVLELDWAWNYNCNYDSERLFRTALYAEVKVVQVS